VDKALFFRNENMYQGYFVYKRKSWVSFSVLV